MKTLIYICGFYNLAFALFHLAFWKIFKWKSELQKLGLVNRSIMQILNVQLIFFLMFASMVCFLFPAELLTTNFGRLVFGGFTGFWWVRLIQQPIYFKMSNKPLKFLTLLFVAGAILFSIPFIKILF